jgi:H+/Cl- antiporter ClcA
MKYEFFIPVLISGLTVLVLGCLNPKFMQAKISGRHAGYPNYLWLAVAALVAGLLAVYLMYGSLKNAMSF